MAKNLVEIGQLANCRS